MSNLKNESSKTGQNPKSSTPLKKNDTNIQYEGMTYGDDVPLVIDAIPTSSKCSKFWEFVCSLKIEPIVFSFFFAFVMNMTVLANMIMDKGCLFYFNYTQEVCQNLSGHPTEKDKVEIFGNNYSLYSTLINLVGPLAMIFIAPFSDKYGRKPPLIVALFGILLADVGFMLCAFYFESKLEYMLLARVPAELFGGFICILTTVFSHVSEVSTEKTRTLKYTCIEIARGSGIALGSLTAGLLYKYYGYFYIYMTAAVLHSFCALWAYFMIKETTGLGINISAKEKFLDFFNCESMKASLTTVFKKRKGHERTLLLLILATMCFYVLTYEAYSSVGYMFVHHVFDWDPSIFSRLNTITQLLTLASTLVLVPILINIFKARDSVLGIIGTVSMILNILLIAFSSQGHEYIYYMGLASGVLISLPALAMRSVISKTVGKDELGRVFSFLSTLEVIIPLLGISATSKIFNATLNIYPSISYLMTAAFLVVPLFTFTWGLKLTKDNSSLKQDTDLNNPISETA